MTPILMGAWASPPAGRRASVTRATRAVEARRLSMIGNLLGMIYALEGSAFAGQIIAGGTDESVYAPDVRPSQGPGRNFRRPARRALQALRGVRQAGEHPQRAARRDGPQGQPSGTDPHFAELTRHL